MSHYSVLLITKEQPTSYDIDEKLAPFDENIEVPRYIAKTKNELIEERKEEILRWKEDYEKFNAGLIKNFNEEYYLEKFKPLEKLLETNDDIGIYLSSIKYYEEDELDEEGNLTSTYNPDSKWDWYQIGGRFSGVFKEDIMQVKDLPKVEKFTEEELIKKYPEEYEYWKRLLEGKENSFYRIEYLKERYKTFSDYIIPDLYPTTYAILDENNKWHEPGSMGWFGMSSASTENEQEWFKTYYDTFINHLPKDYWITIIDCHI